jgi:Tol biopolymer transport system component
MTTRVRTLHLPALLVAAVSVACAAAVLAVSEKAEATFPGKNGRIAYVGGGVIYTINPDGGGKGKVTEGSDPSYSPDGKKVAYSGYDDRTEETELYTVRATGGTPVNVTNDDTSDSDPSWGSRP